MSLRLYKIDQYGHYFIAIMTIVNCGSDLSFASASFREETFRGYTASAELCKLKDSSNVIERSGNQSSG